MSKVKMRSLISKSIITLSVDHHGEVLEACLVYLVRYGLDKIHKFKVTTQRSKVISGHKYQKEQLAHI